MPSVNLYNNSDQGLVKVSTGVLQLEKLSAGDASNHKLNTNANNELAYAAQWQLSDLEHSHFKTRASTM